MCCVIVGDFRNGTAAILEVLALLFMFYCYLSFLLRPKRQLLMAPPRFRLNLIEIRNSVAGHLI